MEITLKNPLIFSLWGKQCTASPNCIFFRILAYCDILLLGGTTSSTQIGGTSKEKALPNGLFHIKGDPRILLENHQGQVRFLNLSNWLRLGIGICMKNGGKYIWMAEKSYICMYKSLLFFQRRKMVVKVSWLKKWKEQSLFFIFER